MTNIPTIIGNPLFDEPYFFITKTFDTLSEKFEHKYGRRLPCELDSHTQRIVCLQYAIKYADDTAKTDTSVEKQIRQAVYLSTLVAQLKPAKITDRKAAFTDQFVAKINGYLAFDIFACLLKLNCQEFAVGPIVKYLKPHLVDAFHAGNTGEIEMMLLGNVLRIAYPRPVAA